VARLQAEEKERLRIEAEQREVARLQAEENERLRIEAEQREVVRLQAEEKERLRIEVEQREVARLQAEEIERLRIEAEQGEVARLQAEEKERLRIEAEQREVARLQAEENERLRIEAEQREVVRLQAEEKERLRIEVEQREVTRLQANENERLRIEAEQREAARLQGEENECLRIEAERQEVAKLHAEKQQSLRIESERQASAARLQAEDDEFHARTPIIPERTSRPGSAALRRRRRQQEEREGQLRGIMHGIATSYSGDDQSVSSVSTFNSMETSLFSHSKNLASGKNLQWEDLYVFVYFGLLTTAEKCPLEGVFDPNDASVNSKILRSVMKKVKQLSRSVIEERSGNILMKCKQPFVTSVKRDESFNEPGRPGVVRSLVQATIPLKVTDVHEELNSTSKIVAKVMIRQALIEGIHRGHFVCTVI